MFEVEYADGADHEGVGTFEKWSEALHFAKMIRTCGYKAKVRDPREGLLDAEFDNDVDLWAMGIEVRH